MGVVPIVNENDTVSVSVSAMFIEMHALGDQLNLGN